MVSHSDGIPRRETVDYFNLIGVVYTLFLSSSLVFGLGYLYGRSVGEKEDLRRQLRDVDFYEFRAFAPSLDELVFE